MINFETNNSTFFVSNKDYCQTVESKLKTINLECSGWCNSHGYDFKTSLNKHNLNYEIKFHKHQSTQNGIVIPVNANEYAGIEIIVKGLNKKLKVTISKSSIRRLFISKESKEKIPHPYYATFNYLADKKFKEKLIKKILEHNISTLKLCNSKLICKIHSATIEPLNLIVDIEEITKNWL